MTDTTTSTSKMSKRLQDTLLWVLEMEEDERKTYRQSIKRNASFIALERRGLITMDSKATGGYRRVWITEAGTEAAKRTRGDGDSGKDADVADGTADETAEVADTGTAHDTGKPVADSGTTGKSFAGFTDPGSVTVAAIEAAWRAVQAQHNEVPDVVVVSGAGADYRKGTVLWGHFHANQWQTDEGTRHELLISGESLSKGARHVLETVLHEAVHAVNHERGTKDTSRRGQYHNKRFVSTANELGLTWPKDTDPHTVRGFSAVQVTDEAAEAYADALATLEAGRAAWRDLLVPTADGSGEGESGNADGEDEADDKPKRTRSRNTKPKAECECGPEMAIWASRRVLERMSVYCGDCGGSYRLVEPDED